MTDEALTVVVVAAVMVAGLLVLRRLLRISGWIRRTRRPETRSIRVIGVGGGGSNAVDRMIAARIPDVSFVAINTDAQALRRSKASTKIRIGASTTRGLGSGGNPDVGRRSAEEDEARIAKVVVGADLVFITAGLGGGTGSGAAPIVGANARLQGALTIAVVTTPFAFEGGQRQRIADIALADLAAHVDAVITVPNDRVTDVVADDTSMLDAFRAVDDVLLQAVRGIIDLLRGPGLINLDFADVRTVLYDVGPALIGLGRGSGENRAIDAAHQAIASPLLEARIQGANGILFNVSGPANLRLREVRDAADAIRASADPDAFVIFGASFSRRADAEVLITLIATGLDWPEGSEAAHREASLPPEQEVAERPGAATEPALAGVPVMAGPNDSPRLAAKPPPNDKPNGARVIEPSTLSGAPAGASTDEVIDLDTPSFLRRKQSP